MSAIDDEELEEEQRKAISIGQARPLFKVKTPEEERAWQKKLAEMLESERPKYANDIARLYQHVFPEGDYRDHPSASKALEAILDKLKIKKNPDGSFLMPRLAASEDPQIYIYAILLAIKENSAVPIVNAQGKSTPQEAIALLKTTLSMGLSIHPDDLPGLVNTIDKYKAEANLSAAEVYDLDALIYLSEVNTNQQAHQQENGQLLSAKGQRAELLEWVEELAEENGTDFNKDDAGYFITQCDREITDLKLGQAVLIEEAEEAFNEADSLGGDEDLTDLSKVTPPLVATVTPAAKDTGADATLGKDASDKKAAKKPTETAEPPIQRPSSSSMGSQPRSSFITEAILRRSLESDKAAALDTKKEQTEKNKPSPSDEGTPTAGL